MPNGDDKNWIRLCAAIDGFRARFGEWPKRVRLTEGALSDIRDRVLESDGFALVSAKLDLVCENDATMIAESDAVGSYDYGAEGSSCTLGEQRAEVWLLESQAPKTGAFGKSSAIADFLANADNEHKVQGNPKVQCNALYKTKENVNALLTASQAMQLAQYLLMKAQLIVDNCLDDAAVHLWNQGQENERFYIGLTTARKGPRQKKKA